MSQETEKALQPRPSNVNMREGEEALTVSPLVEENLGKIEEEKLRKNKKEREEKEEKKIPKSVRLGLCFVLEKGSGSARISSLLRGLWSDDDDDDPVEKEEKGRLSRRRAGRRRSASRCSCCCCYSCDKWHRTGKELQLQNKRQVRFILENL